MAKAKRKGETDTQFNNKLTWYCEMFTEKTFEAKMLLFWYGLKWKCSSAYLNGTALTTKITAKESLSLPFDKDMHAKHHFFGCILMFRFRFLPKNKSHSIRCLMKTIASSSAIQSKLFSVCQCVLGWRAAWSFSNDTQKIMYFQRIDSYENEQSGWNRWKTKTGVKMY